MGGAILNTRSYDGQVLHIWYSAGCGATHVNIFSDFSNLLHMLYKEEAEVPSSAGDMY